MKITILIDNESWIIPYGEKLQKQIQSIGHYCNLIFKHIDVAKGDLLILLGCIRIFKKLHLNKNNIVIHPSDLPKGKGWSPLTWQILERKNIIPISLFEATNEMDAGDIYIKDNIILDGSELFDEIKHKQGIKTIQMVLKYINEQPRKVKQSGNSTFYKRRTPKNSKLDINKTILENFNLLRVCSNKFYPAFFVINDQKYILKIYKDNN